MSSLEYCVVQKYFTLIFALKNPLRELIMYHSAEFGDIEETRMVNAIDSGIDTLQDIA